MSSNLQLQVQTQEDLDQVENGRKLEDFDIEAILDPVLSILRSGTFVVSTEERRLTLAYEGLIRLPTLLLSDYGPIIEILDLSHNSISNLDFLSQFPNLSTLILDHNWISGDTPLPRRLPSLTTLWLNHNRISSLHPFIPRLAESTGGRLKTLSLMGNDAAPSYLNGGTYYQYLQYRFFVISWLGSIEYLDDRQVTSDQRIEARRLYGRKLLRNLKQSLTLHQYNPSAVLKKFKNMFANKFGGRENLQNVQNHEQNEIERRINDQNEENLNHGFINGEEGFLVEEIGLPGFLSDSTASSLNSLNNFGSEIAFEFNNPDPFSKDGRRKEERNLVI